MMSLDAGKVYHGLFSNWVISGDSKPIFLIYKGNKTVVIKPEGDICFNLNDIQLAYSVGNRNHDVVVTGVYNDLSYVQLPMLQGYQYQDKIIIIVDDNYNHNELSNWVDNSINEMKLKTVMKDNGISTSVLFKTLMLLIKANISNTSSNSDNTTDNETIKKWLDMFKNVLSKTEILYKEI